MGADWSPLSKTAYLPKQLAAYSSAVTFPTSVPRRCLATSPKVLELRGIRLTVTAVPRLTGAPWSALLCSLTLDNCGLNSATISQLAAANWPLLQHLHLRNNKLGETAVKAMAGGKWPHLAHLDFSSNKLNADAITQLAWFGWTYRLSGLEVHDNPGMGVNAVRILGSVMWPHLKGLGISGGFELRDFVPLAASAWPHLELLYLECNYCPPLYVSFTGLWQNLQNFQLRTHEPSRHGQLPLPARLGLLHADWRNLRSLSLSYSHLCGRGFFELAYGDWPLLGSLDVSHLWLTEDEHDFLPEDYAGFAMGYWPQLTHLCLSHNRVNSECAAKLIRANWPKLQTLDLSYNDIGATGFESLAQGDCPAMKHLCLHGNKPECLCQYCTLQDVL
ncbi:hypothetical protein ABBQ38_006199 [Trebouxia sp. C0009 RCD-2024]